jgi:uncharacterized protein (TIGR02246 family)
MMHQLFVKTCVFLISALFCVASIADEIDSEEAAKIKLEITQLVNDYAIYRDRLDARNYANLFAEDGRLTVRGRLTQGREAIYERISGYDSSHVSMHIMTSSQINIIDRDHATGVHYAAVYSAAATDDSDRPIPVKGFTVLGQYHDKYVRTEEGWKFAERVMKPVFRTAE